MDVQWSKDQIRLSLKAVLLRYHANKSSFTIKNEGRNVQYTNYSSGKSIYLTIDSDDRVYLSLDSHSGFFRPSIWWWKDLEIKECIRELRNLGATNGRTSGEILVECFPEVITEEFEKQVLGVKDGKSES